MLPRLLTLLVTVGCFQLSSGVKAEDYVVATLASYHFNRSKDYNERNYGLGFERTYEDNWRGHAGAYKNSLDRTTAYVLTSYTPWRWGEWHAGGAAGLGTGYNSRPIGVLVGGFAIREWRNGFGVNVIVHPTALALQIKWSLK